MVGRLCVLVAGAALICAGSAAAQPLAAAAAATTQVYDAAFFSGATVSTAEDMLRRVPGAAAVLDAATPTTQARGLGAGAEQILIDGKRVASKSTSANVILRRIPSSSVERVELIRGVSGEVQSEGLVINVVLKAGRGIAGVGNFEAAYRFTDQGQDNVDGLISYAGNWRGIAYVLGFETAAWSAPATTATQGVNDWTTRYREERYFDPSGAVSELRPQKWRRVHKRDTLTFNATLPFGPGDDSFRVNFVYQANPIKQVDTTALTRVSPAGTPLSRATEEHYNRTGKDTLELGSELEWRIGPGQLNAIGLHSRNAVDFLDFRDRTEATGRFAQLSRSVNEQDTGEDVVRVTYLLPLPRRQTLTLGAEGARNFLNQEIDVFFDLNRDGLLEQIPIPTALAKVSEVRGEFSAKHNIQLGSQWTLESTLAGEISRIETNYPAIPIRTLKFLKPRLDARYNPTPMDRFRFKLERTVGQLDFANFVPAYNVVDSRIDLGNPELKANTTLTVEGAYERRLPNDNGTLGLRLSYRDVDGGPGFVPFGVDANGLPRSRRGNNGTNLIYNVETTASVRLPWLPGAQVNGRLLVVESAVRDQFSLERRRSGPIHEADGFLGFRQDLTAHKVSYGAEYFWTDGALRVSDVRTSELLVRDVRINLFIERALGPNYSIRFDAYGVNGADEMRRRRLFTVSQLDGTLQRSERYEEVRDRRFVVRLRGRF